MWTYIQKTGEMVRNGVVYGNGYSGYEDGKNNPAMQQVHDVGPLPVGKYVIGEPRDTSTHGPFVLPLTPYPDNEMFGRSGFLIHGDSYSSRGMASRGCIIMPHGTRVDIFESGDEILEVVSEEETDDQTG